MGEQKLVDDLAELETAEEFLHYFAIPFDPHVVQVNRLHILQRFHDYIQTEKVYKTEDEAQKREDYARLLQQAYQDFVESDALTEKVFKIFHKDEKAQENFVPIDQLYINEK